MTSFTYSQGNLKFITDNTNDIRKLSDSILLNSKRTYKYKSQGYVTKNYMYAVKYVNYSDTTDIIPIYFQVRIVGSNPDLEKEGTLQYTFYSVTGKYLDLSPFWYKFINPNENTEKLLKSGTTYYRFDDKRLLFSRNSSDSWMLFFKE